MRIWDLHPGYLNRQSLLGEHSELHALVRVVLGGRKGYANHPETIRWRDFLGALAVRHALLVAEMALRGYRHRSPLSIPPDATAWPGYVERPARQLERLREKYTGREPGRIPLPRDAQRIWAQHKYSVLARDSAAYRVFGRWAAHAREPESLAAFADELTELLRRPPSPGGVRNAVEHMWGYVSHRATADDRRRARGSPAAMLAVTQRLAMEHSETYLVHSTALSELAVWLGHP
ncbi:MAG: DUF1722 domain-containing protein [Chloroflexia bacterium]